MHACLITELEGSIHHYWTRSGASTVTSSPQDLCQWVPGALSQV